MKLQQVRKYIIDTSGVDVLTTSRKGIAPTMKALFIQIAYKYCRDQYGKRLTQEAIADFMGIHHSSVLHHLRKEMKFYLDIDPVIKKIYSHYFKEGDFPMEYYKKRLFKLENELKELKNLINV